MKKSLYTTFSIVAIIVIALIWYIAIGRYHIQHLHLYETQQAMLNYVQENYARSAFYYMIAYAILTLLGFPIAIPLTLLGGFLFGFWLGGLYALIASVIGALISFLIVRDCLGHLIKGRYKERLQEFNKRLGEGKVFGYLVSLHLVAVIPYIVINTLAALARIPTILFITATTVGAAPIIFIYSFVGSKFGMMHNISDIFSLRTLYILLILLILSLIPFILRRTNR